MKKFQGLNVSSKFAICGLPIRVDTYKNCSFGCKYCFSNNRVVMKFDQDSYQSANIQSIENRLINIFDKKNIRDGNLLDTLIDKGITWHCGGMSDPFQPIERDVKATEQLVNVCNKYNIPILFSTKSNNLYGANIQPNLHTFQLSVTNTRNHLDIEPNVPSIDSRYRLYRDLKNAGFKVGIRIQPFMPGITDLDIVKMFKDADHFTIEGIKIVPQNAEHKEYILDMLHLDKSAFTQMGLLNLKTDIRLEAYKPFIEYFEKNNMSYSIADNDLHHYGNNACCCGDALCVSTTFNNTAMIKKYSQGYSKNDLDRELNLSGCANCKCNHLFTSNRQEGCITVQDFYNKRFYRKSSPFSPLFLYKESV